MIEQLENYKNKQEIVLLPRFDLDLKDSIEYTLKNVIEIDKVEEDNKIHGLGLWEVRKILNKNNNLNLFTSKDNKFFKQQLEIYC